MVNNPYEVLDMPKGSPEEDLKNRYEELKAKYGEQRFATGEEGNEGARKLMELEEAWKMIGEDLERERASEQFGNDLGHIDEIIKQGKYDEAQSLLDSYTERSAEWHYLQAIVFYKRDWLTESRKQLKMAVDMEPENEKYKTALEKMELVIGNPRVNASTLGQGAPIDPAEAQMTGNCLSSCCMSCCAAEMCMSCTRCCG